ncbi:MAG: CocE/NonD family hydrolase [SAR202 cluster bacterium]|nr:CocE/NonD family hydrolase [SAR202 cluster bacterium]
MSPRFFGSRPPYLPLSSRHDVLAFQTPPLDRAVEIAGPVTVELWASSSSVDTDFTAKLVDVYPASDDYPRGFAMNLCDGIMRAKFREPWERVTPLEPGQPTRLRIQLYPTANLFAKGHRIRLDI